MSSSPSARRSRRGHSIWIAIAHRGVRRRSASLYVTGAGARIVESLYPPAAVTAQGADIRELYNIVFLIAVAIFFVVEGLIVWSVIRYRRKPTDTELPPQTHGNNIAEIIWTVVPTLIVAFLFVISWQTLNAVDTVTAQAETQIRAVAGQFQWEFDYMPADYDRAKDPVDPLYVEYAPTGPEGGLHIPTGRTDPALPDEPGRHPRVLRPAVPVQARRRAGPGQHASTSTSPTSRPAGRSAASAPSCAARATC